MKAILTFNLPKDQYDFSCAIDGSKWRGVVYDLSVTLRNRLKHGHEYKSADEVLEAVKSELWALCNDANIDPWSEE